MTDGASVVGTTPQSRHPGHQMRKFLTKYSAAGTFETVDHFCRTSSRVRCDKQMYVVWHHFHSLDEHAVLLCRGIQNVLEPLSVFEQSAAIAVGRKGDTVVPPERTEARETGLLAAPYPSEERLEGLIQPAEHILAAGEVGQSEQPFFPYGLQLLGLVVVVDALAANFPSIAPFLKGSVVELASLVELVLEKPSLGLVGVQAVFVGGARKQ